MTKKSIYHKVAIFLVAAIVIQMSFIPQTVALRVEPVNDLGLYDHVTEQKDALDAYNAIIEKLKSGELNEDIYAGAYIDGTKLIIMLTNLTDEIKNEYLNIVENPNAVDFEQTKYSLKYIKEQLSETVNMLSDCPITEFGVYESKNKGYISIDKDYYDSFVGKIPNLCSGYDTPIIFEPGEYYDEDITKEKVESESLLNSTVDSEEGYSTTATKDIIGGMPITTSQGTGTIGFCGYYGVVNAILTAGHVVAEGENTEYGKVVQRKYGNNQYGDYAIIYVDSNYNITNNIINDYWGSVDVRTIYSSVPVGTEIFAYGSTSKSIQAEVTATNVSKTSSNTGFTINGLTQTTCTGNKARDGDSGGPVFVTLGNFQVAACGIIQGSNGGTKMCFVPFEHIPPIFNPKTSTT